MGILEELLAGLDQGKKVLIRNVQDLFSNPRDYLQKRADQVTQDFKDMKPEEATNLIPGGSGVGIIRPRGLSDLILTHNTERFKPEAVATAAERPYLTSPSVSIGKNHPFTFGDALTYVFNPRSVLFDPAKHPLNILHNRDFYTTRDKSRGLITSMFKDRPDLRFSEGFIPSESQIAAILASPEFRSFAEYEGSKSGAKTLVPPGYSGSIGYVSDAVWHDVDRHVMTNMPLTQYYGRDTERVGATLLHLRTLAKTGDPKAIELLSALQTLPSKYAEMKVIGHVPKTPEHVVAMTMKEPDVIDKGKRGDFQRAFQELQDKTNIPAGLPIDIAPVQFLMNTNRAVSDTTAKILEEFNNVATPHTANIPSQQSGIVDDILRALPEDAADRFTTRTDTLQKVVSRFVRQMGKQFSTVDPVDSLYEALRENAVRSPYFAAQAVKPFTE